MNHVTHYTTTLAEHFETIKLCETLAEDVIRQHILQDEYIDFDNLDIGLSHKAAAFANSFDEPKRTAMKQRIVNAAIKKLDEHCCSLDY